MIENWMNINYENNLRLPQIVINVCVLHLPDLCINVDVYCVLTDAMEEESTSRTRSRESRERDDTKSSCVSETPSGVNRRSSVLFGKKPQKRTRRDSGDIAVDDPTPNKKGPGRQVKVKSNTTTTTTSVDSSAESTASSTSNVDKKSSPPTDSKPALTSGNSRKRANSSAAPSQDATSDSSQTSSKRPASVSATQISTTIADGPSLFSHSRRESFLQYRNFSQSQSDVDSSSESGSTDTTLSDSDSSSKASTSDNEDGSTKRFSRRGKSLHVVPQPGDRSHIQLSLFYHMY